MIGPNGLPLSGGYRQNDDARQGIGGETNQSRRDPRRDPDPQKGDKFGKALQKAFGTRPAGTDEDPGVVAPVAAFAPPPLQGLAPLGAGPAPAAAPEMRHGQTAADRIDRYLRSAEAQSSLREGQSMLIRLPAGTMGLSHVTVTMRDGVLNIALTMQHAATGTAAQLALLGQAIAQRQPKLAFRLMLSDDEDVAGEPRAPFNPLVPTGKSA